MQSVQNVWGGVGSAWNGTVGRKGLEFLLEVIWESFFSFPDLLHLTIERFAQRFDMKNEDELLLLPP